VITAVDGKRVRSTDALRSAIDAKSPGDRVTLTYRRGGSEHAVRVTLAARPS
jgi:S1-C subfamily serine protease